MIDALKPYPSMKDSGVTWLGEVPEHWEIQRGKTLFRSVDVRSESGLEELLTVSSNHGVVPRRTASVTMFKAESYVGHKLCWPGDLVINSLWAWSRGLGVSRHHGIVSTAYGVYRCRNTNALETRFVHELVRSSPFHWELRVRSKGVWTSRLQLTDESFLGAPFPLPPLPEQAAIVRFLVHADRLIRRYIRAKQKLIKLLEEQKQAIIHRAVTRGLDPNVRLKSSGVEWFGDVPEHWEVLPFKRKIRFQEGPGIMAVDFRETGIPLLRISCLQSERDPHDGCNYLEPELVEKKWKHFLVKAGDLILNGSSSASTILVKKAGQDWENCIPYTGLIRLWSNQNDVSPDYVSLLIQSTPLQGQLLLSRTGVGVAHFGPSHLNKLWIVLPPIDEQHEIHGYVQNKMAGVKLLESRLEAEIGLLREYRTRLIADVVTGKLDVQEAAAGLPEEVIEHDVDEDEDGVELETGEEDLELNDEADG